MSTLVLLARGAAGLAISYTVVCGLLYVFQRSFIYHPTPVVSGPGEVEIPEVDGAVLRLQVLRRPGAKVLMYFGGNGEAVAASAPEFADSIPDRTLVFVTPFDSLVAVARRAFRYFPVEWILKDRYESTRYARSISCPVLVVMGTEDEVIRPVHARELAKVFATGQARSIEVPGAHHNDIQLWPRYGAVIGEFVG